MTATAGAIIEPNPFSTRRVRPGAIPYLFLRGDSIVQLVSRLRANDWRGQIIGPHGSGKSTLLATLIPELRRAGVAGVVHELHDWSRRLPAAWNRRVIASRETVVVIDGFELLPWFSRFWMNRRCRERGYGLLVTAHEPVGLPDLYCTNVSLEAAQRLTSRLVGDEGSLVTERDVASRLAANGGDLRATFFDLYDLFEARRRGHQWK